MCQCFFLTAFTTKSNDVNVQNGINSGGLVTIKWKVKCPNGQIYEGSTRVPAKHGAAAALRIANAPCPK